MIAFLEPLGLTALAALALPVAVHLWRRRPLDVISFPALGYLRPQDAAPARRWQLRRRLLLLLRLLLIATLALLLATPVWQRAAQPGPPWILVVPGIAAAGDETLAVAAPANRHWLLPGYPAYTRGRAPPPPAAATARDSVWSLLRERDAVLPGATPLIVIAPAAMAALDGERPSLRRRVDWRVVPGAYPDGARTAPGGAAEAPAAPRAALRYDVTGRAELGVARAIVAAWLASGRVAAVDDAALPAAIPQGTAELIWLADPQSPPLLHWLAGGGSALVTPRGRNDGPQSADLGSAVLLDEQGGVILRERAVGRGRLFTLSAPLAVGRLPALSTPDFPGRLETVLAPRVAVPTHTSGAAAAPSFHPMPPQKAASAAAAANARPLDSALGVIALMLYLAERLCAKAWRRREDDTHDPRAPA